MAHGYLEDFHVGEQFDLGTYTFTREEIIEFATKYDPQPFHLDEEAARQSPFGGLVASGWHTSAAAMRLIVERFLRDSPGSVGSPGADELRWLEPVRPGDTVALTVEVVEVRPSQKRPDRGSIRLRYTLTNQSGTVVMQMIGIGIFLRRPGGATVA